MHFRDLESGGGAGITSGYRRPPLAIALNNGAWYEESLSTPHKRTNLERFPSIKNSQDYHPASPKAREPSSFSNLKPDSTITTMTMSKLSRSTSSLSRSPTIKSNIDSLSNLSDAVRSYETGIGGLARDGSASSSRSFDRSFEKNVGSAGLVREASRNRAVLMGDIEMGFSNSNVNSPAHHHGGAHHSHPHAPHLSHHQQERRIELQVLLPPLVLVTMPFVWWYAKGNPYFRLSGFDANEIVVWFYFDCLVLFVFFTALVVSARLAFPQFAAFLRSRFPNHPLCIVRAVVGQSWGSLSASWLKPLVALLNDDHQNSQNQKQKRDHNPGVSSEKNLPVTWTIGSGTVRRTQGDKNQRFDVGEGVQTFSNGDVYEGEFDQGRCSGNGVYYFYLSGRYEGEWVDGKYNGYGVETWARGSRYRGQYRRGLRDGCGIYRFFTGDVYSGEWSNGQSHGRGTQTCEDGSRYRGEFKWGVKHGYGFYHFRNGDTYAGEYFGDKMHGYGVYQFGHGHRYEGSWHEGRKQGLGMYTFRNGETHAGHWHLGVLEKPSSQEPTPGSPSAVSHAKVLNAVQESRRAAAKAMEVTRVDDRVNKAVGLANRAANAARVAAVRAVQKRHSTPPFPEFVS